MALRLAVLALVVFCPTVARAQLTWVQKQTNTASPGANQPGQRRVAGMAFDESRQKAVLFGGLDVASNRCNDTWEWNGTTWNRLLVNTTTPGSNQPSQRNHFGMVYSSSRQRVVLFGGQDSTGAFLNDTWEWDGTNWSQRQASTPLLQSAVGQPERREAHSLAYDAFRDRVVLFGGEDKNYQVQNDTWEWDGTAWTRRQATGGAGQPQARTNASMVYDAKRRKVVLFGGNAGSPMLNDTWEWDGTAWTLMQSDTASPGTGQPPRRQNAAMAWDSLSQRTVLFSGRDAFPNYFNDTWVWDGASWLKKQSNTASPGSGQPVQRMDAAMAYDSARANLVMFGGQFPMRNDTWTLASPAPAITAITFSKSPRYFKAGDTLALTATFDQEITPTAARITVTGGSVGGVSVSGESMTAGADRAVWTYSATVQASDPTGARASTLSGVNAFGVASGGSVPDSSFYIDNAAPAAPSLTYSRPPAFLGPGALAVTAAYAEAMASTPTLVFSGPGGNRVLVNSVSQPSTQTYVFFASVDTTPTLQEGVAYTLTVDSGADLAGNPQSAAAMRTGIVDTSPPPAPALSFSRGPDYLTAGALSVTAVYAEAVATTPTLSFSGPGGSHGRAISTVRPAANMFVFAAAMDTTATSPGGDDYTVTVQGAVDLAGNAQIQALQAGVVDNRPPPAPVLELSRDPAALVAGALTITATYDEAIVTTPILGFWEAGGAHLHLLGVEQVSAGVFVYSVLVDAIPGSQDGDEYALTVDGASDLAGNLQAAAATRSGVLDNVPPAPPALVFGKGPDRIGGGPFFITATYGEPMGLTPAASFSGAGARHVTVSSVNRPAANVFVFQAVVDSMPTAQAGDAYTFTIGGGTDLAGNSVPGEAGQSGLIDNVSPGVPSLAFSRGPSYVKAGALTITASYLEPLALTPSLAFSGTGSPRVRVNSTRRVSATAYAFDAVVDTIPTSRGGDAFLATISGGADPAGNLQSPATRAGLIDNVAPAAPALTFSRGPGLLGAGSFTVTAVYLERLSIAPRLQFSGLAGASFAVSPGSSPATDTWVFAARLSASPQTAKSGSSYLAVVGGGVDPAGNVQSGSATRTGFADNAPPAVNLGYSQPVQAVTPGSLVISASFDEPLAASPTLSIDRAGTGHLVTRAALTRVTPQVWTYVHQAAAGESTVTILDGADAAGNPNRPATNAKFTVIEPARLAMLGVKAAPGVVWPGQVVAPVSVLVRNTGGEAARVTKSELAVNGSSQGYEVRLSSGVQSIAAGATATIVFEVRVDASAPLGRGVVDAVVEATGVSTGRPASIDRASHLPHVWTVLANAGLAVLGLEAPSEVVRGQRSIPVTVLVTNAGQEAATVTTAWLGLSRAGEDATTHITVVPSPENPTSIPAGSMAVFRFSVHVESNAPVGISTLDAAIAGVGEGSGRTSGAAAPATWRVLKPASLAAAVERSSAVLLRGSSGSIGLSIRNTGQSTARAIVESITLSDPRLSAARIAGPSTSLDGGAATASSFSLDAPLTSVTGTVLATIELTWTDALGGAASSAKITTSLRVLDNAPTAVLVARPPATFDGSGSFDGPAPERSEGDRLTYSWSVLSRPAGSAFTVTGSAAIVQPSPDRKGVYVVGLRVHDGHRASPMATAAVTVSNSPPVAIAGPDRSVAIGVPARLAGRGSDPNVEDVLTYRWSGTGGSFTSPSSAATDFVPALPGVHRLVLSVSDGAATSESSLLVAATNTAPLARAVVQPVFLGQAALLDGTGSTDAETGSLRYSWRFASLAPGSQLTTEAIAPNDSPSAATSRFFPDRKGRYGVSLTVSDGFLASTTEAILLVPNRPPVAVATPAAEARAGEPVPLSGAASADPDADTLSYHWSLLSVPPGSRTSWSATGPSVSFTPDIAGSYLLSLSVDDGTTRSAAAELALVAAARPNRPPVARISADRVEGGPRVFRLDGTASSDPDGDAILYSWTLLRAPAGASPFTSSAASVEYAASLAGAYTFALSVSDSRLLTDTTQTTLSVRISPPLADAGSNRQIFLTRPGISVAVQTTSSVQLDGSRSSDESGLPLDYSWRIVEAPDLSFGASASTTLASLDDARAIRPVLTFSQAQDGDGPLAAAGRYRVLLTVSSGIKSSMSSVNVVAIDPRHLLPRADAGLSHQYTVDVEPSLLAAGRAEFPDPLSGGRRRPYLRLDGRESNDSNGIALAYRWTGPSGVPLSDPAAPTPTFVPLSEGTYDFSLVVSNVRGSSLPSQVSIAVVNRRRPMPPFAAIAARNARRSGDWKGMPLFVATAGSGVVFDAAGSTHVDPALRTGLTYAWTLRDRSGNPIEAGQGLTFAPQDKPGFMGMLSLTVTDAGGRSASTGVAVRLVPVGTTVSRPAVRATASTTQAIGIGFESLDFPGTDIRSLRVTTPTTVTLTALLPRDPEPGTSNDFSFEQLAGPTVLLSRTRMENTTSPVAQSAFSPTTSRVYLFEIGVTERIGGVSQPHVATSFIRVIVDTPESAVPAAAGSVFPLIIPISGSAAQRTITLDGRGSALLRALPGAVLTYAWRQVSGPAGVLENPFAVSTTFLAPDLAGASRPGEYVFELTVDQTPPGDRSEPLYFAVSQQPQSTAPASTFVNLFLGGLALAPAPGMRQGDGGASIPGVVLPSWLPTALSIDLEQVTSGGARFDPPRVLATYVTRFKPSGSTLLAFGPGTFVALSPSLADGVARTATIAPGPIDAPAGAAGGGCGPGPGTRAGWLECLVLLAPLGLVARRRRA